MKTLSVSYCRACGKDHADLPVFEDGDLRYIRCPVCDHRLTVLDSPDLAKELLGNADAGPGPINKPFELLETSLTWLKEEREKTGSSDKGRYLAIAVTDLEKLIAFIDKYLLYI